MEKFEINEHGWLKAYHNDDKNITEITVPEGVTNISCRVFKEYKNLYSVILPDSIESIDRLAFWNCSPHTSVRSIKYRGVTFNPSLNIFSIKETIEMIANKDYSQVLSNDLKYPVIIQIYFNEGDKITQAYIKKNFKKFFVFLIEENDFETIEKLIESGKFITKRNINTYINLADEKECYEVFDMLEKYREENNF